MSEPNTPRDLQPRIPSPKRTFAERQKGKLKDTNLAARAFRLQGIVWGAYVAAITIFVSSIAAGIAGIGPPVIYFMWLGGVLAGVLVSIISLNVAGGGAAVMGKIHNPSGKSTPAVREYSRAQSLVKRGQYSEAVDAYEVAVVEFPEDPDPYIRIARVCRDQLRDYERSLQWFKRARVDAAIDMGRDLVVSQEIIELYRKKLETPRKALPELARIIERFPKHPQAEAAKRELERLRAELRAESGP